MININMLVDHVKARLGASHRQLELSDESIVSCLQNETLRTLSVYFPYYCSYLLKLNDSNAVAPGMNTYFVPQEIEEFEVLSVSKMLPSSGGLNNQSYFFLPGGSDLQSVISMFSNLKLANSLGSQMINPDTFLFIEPNMIRVNNGFATTDMMLILKTTHKKDFTTLPSGAIEMIKKLALYDVAMDIYSIRRYFTNIQTMFAQINLDTSFFESIPDKRDELIEKFRTNQLKSANVKKLYIY